MNGRQGGGGPHEHSADGKRWWIGLGVVSLLLVGASGCGSGSDARQQAGTSAPSVTSTPTVTPTATPTAPPTATPTPPPAPTAAPLVATAPPPTARPAPPPTAPPAPPPACYPLTNAGNCYEPGEFCRTTDHGRTGRAGNGEAIICEYNNGWRWEPA